MPDPTGLTLEGEMSQITQINLSSGAIATHIRVRNRDGSAVEPPDFINLDIEPPAVAAQVTVTKDATGFNLAATGAAATGTAKFSYGPGGNLPQITVPLNILIAPTGLELFSP